MIAGERIKWDEKQKYFRLVNDGTKVFSGFYGGHMQLSENKGSNRRSDFFNSCPQSVFARITNQNRSDGGDDNISSAHSPKQITDEWIRSGEGWSCRSEGSL